MRQLPKYDYLIVGSGLFGATFAYKATQAGKKCLVIDKRPYAGGNVYCEKIEGINVHKYGAHIFHTSNKEVWDFVNSLVPFNRYTNSPIANYHGELYNLPFNMNTFCQIWPDVKTPADALAKVNSEKLRVKSEIGDREPRNLEEQALLLVGRDIYEKLIKEYTEKQWGRKCTELPAFIIRRLPLRFVFDNNYFNDKYQGIPIGGYNELIAKLLEGSEVRTNVDFFGKSFDELVLSILDNPKNLEKNTELSDTCSIFTETASQSAQEQALGQSENPFHSIDSVAQTLSDNSSQKMPKNSENGEELRPIDKARLIADKVVYTGQLDEYFDYRLGRLDWRTVSFKTRVEDMPNYQGNAVVNYTSHEVPYTRVIEHKHFELFGQAVYECPKTVVSEEYSTEYKPGMEPYYPVNDERNNVLAEQYRELAVKEENVIFGGRLAEYKYYDMAPVIERVKAANDNLLTLR